MGAIIIPGRSGQGPRPEGSYRMNSQSHQAQGLKCWWPVTGRRVWDDKISYYHGLPNTGNGFTRHPLLGPCLSFSGTNSYVRITIPGGAASMPQINNTALTVAAWCVPSAVSSTYEIVSIDDNNRWRYRINAGVLNFLDRGGTNQISGTITFAAQAVVHLAATAGPLGLVVYTNGVANATSATAFGGGTNAAMDTAIGSRFPNVDNSPFLGLMADVRIYHRVLSSTEIWNLYSPQTRWDLYWVPSRSVFFDVGGGGGPTVNRRRRVLMGAA